MKVELRLPVDGPADEPARPVVVDTNVALDLLIFSDPRTVPLRTLLAQGRLAWIATQVMRDELERVLAYPHIVERMNYYRVSSAQVLSAFDAQARLVDIAPKVAYVCKDADDQKFIDLAAAHRAILLSKDKAVICMRKRLMNFGADVATALVLEAEVAALAV
ncbi:MAG: putative toxin-antitoxin system toxin component, PIN family [Gammaproteobacteria bacterium]|jgi:putative PIN family toxin of toxin-antitoxin system|nr:putative toxin-antitoxin system toxin component, PIN family [Gammaproteobacteria bacterium]MBU0830242.1 putative toxin-antitoxin system toxin component, PIN family [Gammaproteobacteria bacterium]MBU0891709.1 putative toxin-antitoxin system toxin component, PIN family [Gammaproteobacteria bacterium]MBU1354680.1 putative toxin-antitoxin system toxin component, PIN family [Gammaproteobacteria bacterium]MBU1506543.1 putative toxin-antitoxin system toxin component, PIN family [Gammaproteobacteria